MYKGVERRKYSCSNNSYFKHFICIIKTSHSNECVCRKKSIQCLQCLVHVSSYLRSYLGVSQPSQRQPITGREWTWWRSADPCGPPPGPSVTGRWRWCWQNERWWAETQPRSRGCSWSSWRRWCWSPKMLWRAWWGRGSPEETHRRNQKPCFAKSSAPQAFVLLGLKRRVCHCRVWGFIKSNETFLQTPFTVLINETALSRWLNWTPTIPIGFLKVQSQPD